MLIKKKYLTEAPVLSASYLFLKSLLPVFTTLGISVPCTTLRLHSNRDKKNFGQISTTWSAVGLENLNFCILPSPAKYLSGRRSVFSVWPLVSSVSG